MQNNSFLFNRRSILMGLLSGFFGFFLGPLQALSFSKTSEDEWFLTPDEWRKRLSPAAYNVLRDEGTERPFTSELNNEKREGTFYCAACEAPLFSSKTKFDSGTGWPSFWEPLEGSIEKKSDYKLIVRRTEYHCKTCGGHQGHVFDDGPRPTGKRYCNNGIALIFRSSI